MSAARYVGRVGGLAVAFGVGTAVLTGYGVASADTTSGGESSSTSQGSATSGGMSASSSAGAAHDSNDAGSPRLGSTSDGSDVASDGDDSAADDVDSRDGALDEADIDAIEDADEAAPSDSAQMTAGEDQSEALAWLSSPEAMAGRAAADPAPASQAAISVPTPGLDLVGAGVEPLAGDEPAAPPAGLPVDLAMAAAARRENIGGIFTNPITVDPTIGFVDGVIEGGINGQTTTGAQLIYTVTGAPQHGKVFVHRNQQTGDAPPDPLAGVYNYLPDSSLLAHRGTDEFTVMVSELSGLMTLLKEIPLLGAFVQPIVLRLQEIPILGAILQPIIGYRTFATVDVDIDELVPVNAPVAFTSYVTSFDGVQISTNFFPAAGLAPGEKARTILNGPGLGAPGNINAKSVMTTFDLVPGMVPLRDAGYNVVTWDPRGEHASGGIMQLDNPFYEGRDTQAIIEWVTGLSETLLEAAGDPVMGMVGGSYGGGIQWTTAGIDDRIDAIVPVIAWHSLNEALYPTELFKTAAGDLLGTVLRTTGARVNSQIYPAIFLGSLFGHITPTQQAVLGSAGPTVLVNEITAPALIIQGTVDILFDLAQASENAKILQDNGVPVQMLWVCGGHGSCLYPTNPNQTELILKSTMDWLDRYVNDNSLAPTGPTFQWFDQNGDYHFSELLPTDPVFHGPSLGAAGPGGPLPIVPVGGGSRTLHATEARIAVNLEIPQVQETTLLVGTPELTLTYQGRGTHSHIFAQLVDNATGLVIGNAVTPVPVTLDGRLHEVTLPMEQIAFTLEPGNSIKLQVFGSALQFAHIGSWGLVDIDGVATKLQTVGNIQEDASVVEAGAVAAA
ncbi:MAG: CocE/NonD family hydrolase [Mycolicibacterium sp.]|uniref:S15 peptidase family protein n=1 Tax=Mycolicibacterium sp. TaxID=2320850 RepID=UPI003D105304